MKARRSKPPTPLSNTLLVLGVGFVVPVVWRLLRGTLGLDQFVLIAVVSAVVGALTYGISWVAYRRR